jgi:hypothetical protein
MMILLNRILTIIVVYPILVSSAVADDKKPEWVKRRPTGKDYYVGIGVAQKSLEDRRHIRIARDIALNDLASQITVNVSGEVVRNVVEKSGLVEEEFRSHIHTSTRTILEEYELVATWEDSREYWVYFRLSKLTYENQKRRKLEQAVRLSLDFFDEAKKNESENNISKALLFCIKALFAIEDHMGESLEVTYEGTRSYLFNLIYFRTVNLLSKIELKWIPDRLNAKIGLPISTLPEISASYYEESDNQIPISTLPLRFSFNRGSGDFVDEAITDQLGKAKCQLSKITSIQKNQIITAQLDIQNFINQEDPSAFLADLLKGLSIPSTQLNLDVSSLSAFIDSEEIHFGRHLSIKKIEPSLKNELSKIGFVFVEAKAKADLVIEIRAESSKRTSMQDFYTSDVDLTVSVIDLSSGDQIYKNSINRVKGVDLDYDKAGLKAFKNAADRLNETILPEIVSLIQK